MAASYNRENRCPRDGLPQLVTSRWRKLPQELDRLARLAQHITFGPRAGRQYRCHHVQAHLASRQVTAVAATQHVAHH
eukprot:410933-Pleurochrysis_carterae.AAC.1